MSCTLYIYTSRHPRSLTRERDKSLRKSFFLSLTLQVISLCAILLQLYIPPPPPTVKYNNMIYNIWWRLEFTTRNHDNDGRRGNLFRHQPHFMISLYLIYIYIIIYTLLKSPIKFRLETYTYTCAGWPNG